MNGTKQVIVVRKDLNMRKGKIAAQAAHASMSFLTKDAEIKFGHRMVGGGYGQESEYVLLEPDGWSNSFSGEVEEWLSSSFKKVCVYVESLEDLNVVHRLAREKGLVSHMITDSGLTEFGGVPTKTCLAIGPHHDEKFEGITSHLPLY